MQYIKLTELIDRKILQRIQDGFSKYTGMAVLITDAEGIPVTRESGFTDICSKFIRKSERGCKNCQEWDKQGALRSLHRKKASSYICHAGLVDFASPIMVEEQFVGSVIAGQVRCNEINEKKLRITAKNLGIDEEVYLQEFKKVKYMSKEEVDKAAQLLMEIARLLSEMAYQNYVAHKTRRQIEQTKKSQQMFVKNLNDNIATGKVKWMEQMQSAMQEDDKDKRNEILQLIMQEGTELISNLSDTLEYMRMTEGKIGLEETEYDIEKLILYLWNKLKQKYCDYNVELELTVDEDVPKSLLGDAGKLGQILVRLIQRAIVDDKANQIRVHVSCYQEEYALYVNVNIWDDGKGISPWKLQTVRNYITNRNQKMLDTEKRSSLLGISIVGLLLHQLLGKAEVDSVKGEWSSFTISVPQLRVG